MSKFEMYIDSILERFNFTLNGGAVVGKADAEERSVRFKFSGGHVVTFHREAFIDAYRNWVDVTNSVKLEHASGITYELVAYTKQNGEFLRDIANQLYEYD